MLQEKGAGATIEEHVFSHCANFTDGGDALTHGTLSRLYARIYHPLIFVGYGLEFGQLGLVAEGMTLPLSVFDIHTHSMYSRPSADSMPPN